MSNVIAVTKILSLDLTDIPLEKVGKAKREVGDYLVNAILREVGTGKSPVEGERFLKLGKAYAKKFHGGRRLPILELEGALHAALGYDDLGGSKLEVGIKGKQAPKADGHNQISSESKAWAAKTDRTQYKRRYIPDKKQNFKKKILNEITSILDEFREIEIAPEESEDFEVKELTTAESVVTTPETSLITNTDFFSDDVIEQLLLDAIRRRNGN